MRLIQLYGIGTLTVAYACSGTVNNYYINAGGSSNAGAAAIGGASATGGGGVIAATGGASFMGGSGGAAYSGGRPSTGGIFGSGGSLATGGKGGLSGTGGTSSNIENGIASLTQPMLDSITSAACAGWSTEAQNSPALVDFVVDTSGSMGDIATNTSDGRSKWAITSEVLQNTFGSLPASTGVGMLLWPNMPTVPNRNTDPIDTANCVNEGAMVPIAQLGAVGSNQRNRLGSTLSGASPVGGTPSADAYNYALGYGMIPATLAGDRYMVFVTDGQPTIQLGCMGTGQESYPVDFQPLLASIAGASASPLYVKTFVVGLPGSEHQSSTGSDGRAVYSAAARSGGTAPASCSDSGPNYCHYDLTSVVDFGTGLTAALQNIMGKVLSCDFWIRNVPSGQTVNRNALNVIYRANGSSALGDMKLVAPSDSSCPQGNGWYLDPADATHLILCANTCDLIHKDAGAVLDLRGGCQTIVLIN